jgi:ribonuclease HII
VVAATVLWDFNTPRPTGINDSKLLSVKDRERLARQIRRRCIAWGIGICHAEEIDMINILEATRLAAVRAVQDLHNRLAEVNGGELSLSGLVTDALEIPGLGLPILAIVKGDQKSTSVASASILAKTTRDSIMDHYGEEFPEYGWKSNRGYPTEDHFAALSVHGPSTLHRMTFRGVGFFCERPRHSKSFEWLARRIASGGDDQGFQSRMVEEMEAYRDRLPPREMAELMAMIYSGS